MRIANVNINNILLINPAGWQKESINLGLSLLAGSLKQAKFKNGFIKKNS